MIYNCLWQAALPGKLLIAIKLFLQEMKIVYLILAHKNPAQLLRLVNRLDTENVTFFIHIDKDSDIRPFKRLIPENRVTFIENRRSTPWGRLGVVRATYDGMRLIENTVPDYDYIVLLSGQDYPIKSNAEIFERLSSNNKQNNYIHCHPFELFGDRKAHSRFEQYYFRINKRLIGYPDPNMRSVKGRVFQAVAGLFYKYPRPFLPGISPVFGSQWWALNKQAIQYIIRYLEANPQVFRFFKRTLLPDEMLFQSVLYGTGNQKIMETITPGQWLTFNHWNRAPELYPQPLNMKDYESIKNSDKLFARKFETGVSDELMDKIDQLIDAKPLSA